MDKEYKWGVKIIHFNLKTGETSYDVQYKFRDEENSLNFYDSLDHYGMRIS